MKRCKACGNLPGVVYAGDSGKLDPNGICDYCRRGEPQAGDTWRDTKSTEHIVVHHSRNGKVLFHDKVLARDRGPVKRMWRRAFLNRYRFVSPA